jgi:hypothetical protein
MKETYTVSARTLASIEISLSRVLHLAEKQVKSKAEALKDPDNSAILNIMRSEIQDARISISTLQTIRKG